MKGETTSRRRAGRNVRSGIFWGADTLRGSPIGLHWKDLEEMYEVGIEEAAQGRVDYRLENILDIACRTTKFYERHKLEEGLSSFPVVDKNIIRTNLGAFLSSAYPDRERIPAITSGSTGTPFVTYQNREKKHRNIADTLFFSRLAGYELGEKLFYLKIWSELNHKSRVLQHLQNVVPVDVLDLQVKVPKVIDTMNRCRSSINILGYVSAIETICRTLDRHKKLRPTVNVNSIITMSEGLDDYTKQAGERHFGCPVLARYSNIENGIIAQQTVSERSSLVVNTASYLIEILDLKSDDLVPDGSLGRIVVTDFFSSAMPLIRYDTGDIGAIGRQKVDGKTRLVFTKIEGRKLDQIYNTKGELVSSYVVYKNMWKYTEIGQYQLIQQGTRNYLFRISMSTKFERERDLIEEFKSYLGHDAEFRVDYVSEIPLLNSGKRKKIVNEIRVQE